MLNLCIRAYATVHMLEKKAYNKRWNENAAVSWFAHVVRGEIGVIAVGIKRKNDPLSNAGHRLSLCFFSTTTKNRSAAGRQAGKLGVMPYHSAINPGSQHRFRR